MPSALRLALTGPPKIGKTTVVERLVTMLEASGTPVGGFVTTEVREHGVRVAFAVRDLAGPSAVIAHVNSPSDVRVGKFGVDVPAFESIGLDAIERALGSSAILIIDEIANMELASPAFVGLLPKVLQSGQPVVMTMHSRAHPVTDQLRNNPAIEVIEVTEQNRDDLPAWIANRLSRPRWRGLWWRPRRTSRKPGV